MGGRGTRSRLLCRALPPGLSKQASARVPPAPSHVTQEAGSQDPLHVTPRGRDPQHVTGGGSQAPSSRDRGEGAQEPVARLGPAPSSLALSTPGSGARRSHDLWGRGCRSEEAGEPGRSGNKGRGSEAGAAASAQPGARPLPPLPVQTCGGAGKTERRLPEPGSPTPSQGFHLSPGVCGGGEPDQHHPPTQPFPHTLAPASPKNAGGAPRVVGTRGPSPAYSPLTARL